MRTAYDHGLFQQSCIKFLLKCDLTGGEMPDPVGIAGNEYFGEESQMRTFLCRLLPIRCQKLEKVQTGAFVEWIYAPTLEEKCKNNMLKGHENIHSTAPVNSQKSKGKKQTIQPTFEF
nr:hypothetical protein [Hydrogenimonas cancrithermarum]